MEHFSVVITKCLSAEVQTCSVKQSVGYIGNPLASIVQLFGYPIQFFTSSGFVYCIPV